MGLSIHVQYLCARNVLARDGNVPCSLFIDAVPGRRESGDLNASDMILVVLIAEAASPGLGGEASSIFDSLVVVATVLLWATLLDIGSYRWTWLDNLTAPRPRPLIRDGKIVQKTARREFLTKDEILSQLRINGFQELSEVKSAHLEPSG